VNLMTAKSRDAEEKVKERQGRQRSELRDMPHHPAPCAHVQAERSGLRMCLPMDLKASEVWEAWRGRLLSNPSQASPTAVKSKTAPQTDAAQTAPHPPCAKEGVEQAEAAHGAWVVGVAGIQQWVVGIQQDASGQGAVSSVPGGSGSDDAVRVDGVGAGRPEGVALPRAAVARAYGPGSEARGSEAMAPTARELAAASEEVQRRATQAGLHWIHTHTHLAPPPASSRAGTSNENLEERRTLSCLPAASLWQQPAHKLVHQPDKPPRAASGSRLCVQAPRDLTARSGAAVSVVGVWCGLARCRWRSQSESHPSPLRRICECRWRQTSERKQRHSD
jgi:hypothetical protein